MACTAARASRAALCLQVLDAVYELELQSEVRGFRFELESGTQSELETQISEATS